METSNPVKPWFDQKSRMFLSNKGPDKQPFVLRKLSLHHRGIRAKSVISFVFLSHFLIYEKSQVTVAKFANPHSLPKTVDSRLRDCQIRKMAVVKEISFPI